MAFKSSLIIKDDFGLPFELVEELVYTSPRLGRTIRVPIGFKTDLASIPIGLWNLLPKSGRYDRAAVIHDYLYQFNTCQRADADGVLKDAMEELEVGWRSWLIYRGVRLGGWKVWNSYRESNGTI